MRRSLLLLSLPLTLIAPGHADACSIAVGIFGASPEAGVAMPSNGQLLVSVSPGPESITAVSIEARGIGVAPLTWRALGPNHALIGLPEPVPSASTVHVQLTPGGETVSLDVFPVVGRDTTVPTDPTNLSLEGEYDDFDECFGAGYQIRGTFTAASDDLGVAGYAFVELLPNDDVRVRGVILEAENLTFEQREFSIFVPEANRPPPGAGFCLALRAFDRAGNWSSGFGETGCLSLPMMPPEQVDAGVVDSGVTPDAGTRDGGSPIRDAGSGPENGGELDQIGRGCGCETNDGAPAGWGLFAVILAALRVTRRR